MSDRIEHARCGSNPCRALQRGRDGISNTQLHGHTGLDVAKLSGDRRAFIGRGSWVVSQRRQRDRGGRKPALVGGLHRPWSGVCGLCGLANGGWGGVKLSDGLCRGKVAVDGQRLCHRADLFLARHSARFAAPRVVLGRFGGDRAARHHDRTGGHVGRAVSLGALCLCRLPDLDRHQNAAGHG